VSEFYLDKLIDSVLTVDPGSGLRRGRGGPEEDSEEPTMKVAGCTVHVDWRNRKAVWCLARCSPVYSIYLYRVTKFCMEIIM